MAAVGDFDGFIGRMAGDVEGIADQQAAGFHFLFGLIEQIRHRHRRQEGIDHVVFAEAVGTIIAEQQLDVRQTGETEAEPSQGERKRCRFNAGEMPVRAPPGEVEHRPAEAAAEVGEPDPWLIFIF